MPSPEQPARTLLSWSSGKDSAWTLYQLQNNPAHHVVGLLTTLNIEFERVAMHGVRQTLLEAQAAAANLPLVVVPIPWPCSNAEYEAALRASLENAVAELNITHIAFGDLYLQDIRDYREQQLRDSGLQPIFPLWEEPTAELAHDMIAAGLRAHITCVDPKQLSADFAGRSFDAALLADLPAGVDYCGENGEFHTFTWAGPMFNHDIAVTPGDVVERDGFIFADITLADEHCSTQMLKPDRPTHTPFSGSSGKDSARSPIFICHCERSEAI